MVHFRERTDFHSNLLIRIRTACKNSINRPAAARSSPQKEIHTFGRWLVPQDDAFGAGFVFAGLSGRMPNVRLPLLCTLTRLALANILGKIELEMVNPVYLLVVLCRPISQ
jgi:hypothetical protein